MLNTIEHTSNRNIFVKTRYHPPDREEIKLSIDACTPPPTYSSCLCLLPLTIFLKALEGLLRRDCMVTLQASRGTRGSCERDSVESCGRMNEVVLV